MCVSSVGVHSAITSLCKAMCEEISYDEIYMPGELDADADTARTQNSRSAEDNNATSPEPSEGKPTASHPPNEVGPCCKLRRNTRKEMGSM